MEKGRNGYRKHQMKYPAPYSQSWSGMDPWKSILFDSDSTKTISRIDNITRKYSVGMPPTAQNSKPLQRFSKHDPTMSHLKYGVFPKKMYISRGQSRILTIKPSARVTSQAQCPGSPKRPRCIVEPKHLKIERPAIAKASTVQKFLQNQPNAHGESSCGPVFVFRPLEHRNLSKLTLSASTHLDIKPRSQRIPYSQHHTRYL